MTSYNNPHQHQTLKLFSVNRHIPILTNSVFFVVIVLFANEILVEPNYLVSLLIILTHNEDPAYLHSHRPDHEVSHLLNRHNAQVAMRAFDASRSLPCLPLCV